MRQALWRPNETGLGFNTNMNALWSTMHKDPVSGPRIIAHLLRSPGQCPWSMHKLHPACVPAVYRSSRACHSHGDSGDAEGVASRHGIRVDVSCWWRVERKERERIRISFGWNDTQTVPLEELFARRGVYTDRQYGYE